MLPGAGLVYQRGGFRPAAAEDDGGDGHASGALKLGGDAGAVLGRSGEAGVGVRPLLRRGLAVPGAALPAHRVLRGILVQTLPPHGVVVQVVNYIGEDGVLSGGGQGVGVGLDIGAGGHAEEAVLRVHGPQPAVLADAQPGDVVPHTPGLLVVLRGDEHGQVGLAAGGGEGGGQVAHLPLGVLHAQNEHVLRHPALLAAQVGGDA